MQTPKNLLLLAFAALAAGQDNVQTATAADGKVFTHTNHDVGAIYTSVIAYQNPSSTSAIITALAAAESDLARYPAFLSSLSSVQSAIEAEPTDDPFRSQDVAFIQSAASARLEAESALETFVSVEKSVLASDSAAAASPPSISTHFLTTLTLPGASISIPTPVPDPSSTAQLISAESVISADLARLTGYISTLSSFESFYEALPTTDPVRSGGLALIQGQLTKGFEGEAILTTYLDLLASEISVDTAAAFSRAHATSTAVANTTTLATPTSKPSWNTTMSRDPTTKPQDPTTMLSMPSGSLIPQSVSVISAVWVTETVTSYTTFCPDATTISVNDHTYTATASEILTITDCPCTISHPASSAAAPASLDSNSLAGISLGGISALNSPAGSGPVAIPASNPLLSQIQAPTVVVPTPASQLVGSKPANSAPGSGPSTGPGSSANNGNLASSGSSVNGDGAAPANPATPPKGSSPANNGNPAPSSGATTSTPPGASTNPSTPTTFQTAGAAHLLTSSLATAIAFAFVALFL